jgi:hypothetical protein
MARIIISRRSRVIAYDDFVEDGNITCRVRRRTLRPGTVLRVVEAAGDVFHLRGLGWVELPPDAYLALPPVSVERFVITWQRSPTAGAVALALHHPIRQVRRWERRLRGEGARLKNMPVSSIFYNSRPSDN